MEFAYTANPARVIFGSGTIARLPEEAERLGLKRILVLSTPAQQQQARRIAEPLGSSVVATFTGAVMHTPVSVTQQAMDIVRAEQVDGVVAVGGGSTTGLAKAIAVRTDVPQIIIPTTYAGSEMTPVLGETNDGSKTTRSCPKILPEVVIYDVDLTVGLPPELSGMSGINAIAHAVEALYAKDRNPIISMMAIEAVTALARSLPAIAADPGDRTARTDALYGAWLAGVCLGAVGMSIHHKLCHTLGGMFGLPHAETHCVVLPHALAYNLPTVPDVAEKLGIALGSIDPALALYDLAGRVGSVRSLRELGMAQNAIDEATDRALAQPYWNPRLLERDSVRDLISRAWAGQPPTAERRDTIRLPVDMEELA